MKKAQQDSWMDEQESVVHNHTLKEALEAKRTAAAQRAKNTEKSAISQTKEKERSQISAKKKWLLFCTSALAVVLVLVAALRFLAPNRFCVLFGIDPLKSDGVVLTIDEYEISRDEYLSYVVPAKQLLEETYGQQALAQREDLLTLVQQSAEETLFARYTLLKWASEYGITPETITEEEFKERKEKTIAAYGGEAAYKAALDISYSTESVQDLKLRQDMVVEKLTQELSDGEEPLFTVTDAQVKAYYEENKLYSVKHVLLLAGDYATATEKLESAKKILVVAKAGEPFDELIKLYSEDAEKEKYLEGYVCQPGEQEPSFEKAALSVAPGEIYGEVVSTPYGYHVIQRIQPDAQLLHTQLDSLIVDARIAQKRIKLQSEMLVQYAPGYDNISFAGIDEALNS